MTTEVTSRSISRKVAELGFDFGTPGSAVRLHFGAQNSAHTQSSLVNAISADCTLFVNSNLCMP